MVRNIDRHADHTGRNLTVPDRGDDVQELAGMAVVFNGDLFVDDLTTQGAREAVTPDIKRRVRSRLAIRLEATDGTVALGRDGILHQNDTLSVAGPAFERKVLDQGPPSGFTFAPGLFRAAPASNVHLQAPKEQAKSHNHKR